ncbi:hypothetical protein BO70DRAFT_358599 [Aspergillus heteromorphus CBS 117.55]|uniref:Uncharacterized protein n=1 Tax=Aspergillus heteromorphus CBS 117.55 TaxID=1448321 RepID=A0A317X0V5_9EURO|nr:uncharacterized protein BO70DRAFT_358599 [Aspergillus heteromorphus CBS 117.55]PWY91167.1 hypothetical protein BO70DRAFT_358599 [Aspergillus heteromorphus CBS 117.55]
MKQRGLRCDAMRCDAMRSRSRLRFVSFRFVLEDCRPARPHVTVHARPSVFQMSLPRAFPERATWRPQAPLRPARACLPLHWYAGSLLYIYQRHPAIKDKQEL